MSYEALIDKVLELQESLHAGAGPATSGGGIGGGGEVVVEGGAVTSAPLAEVHSLRLRRPRPRPRARRRSRPSRGRGWSFWCGVRF